MNKYKISVIICTYNRKDYLKKAIDSLLNQTISTDNYEIIVVDNNSNDGTDELIFNQYLEYQNVKYILEINQGLSYARNTGWKNAKTDYIAFIDDDEIPAKNWIESIINAINNTQDINVGAIGGKIEPIWEIEKPKWLKSDLEIYLSVFRIWKEKKILNFGEILIGGNITYPKHILEEIGGFNISLGRNRKNLISGEETFLNRILQNYNYKLYYDPDITVFHHIPAERLTKKWFLKRLFWGGYSHAFITLYENYYKKFDTNIIYIALHNSIHLFFNYFLSITALIFFFNKKYLTYFFRSCEHLGFLYGIYKIKNQSKC